MKEGRLHIRVDEDLSRRVKRLAKQRNVTVTALIEMYLRRLLEEEKRSQEPVDAEQI